MEYFNKKTVLSGCDWEAMIEAAVIISQDNVGRPGRIVVFGGLEIQQTKPDKLDPRQQRELSDAGREVVDSLIPEGVTKPT